jgi:hypothetical protein
MRGEAFNTLPAPGLISDALQSDARNAATVSLNLEICKGGQRAARILSRRLPISRAAFGCLHRLTRDFWQNPITEWENNFGCLSRTNLFGACAK